MKKKLLFVMPSLAAGGGEKSLVTLLAHLDYEQYDVDLFLFNPEGIFMSALPKQVRLLETGAAHAVFSLPLLQSLRAMMADRSLRLMVNRIGYFLRNQYRRGSSVTEQQSWKYIASALQPLEQKYDVAIGFLEKSSTYFCVDKVRADKKIGWIHIDYDKLGMDPHFDNPYFQQLDYIVTVSEECENILKRRFPQQQDKIRTIHNIVSPKLIKGLSQGQSRDVYGRKGKETILLSIGRLHPQKGFPLAIEACSKLIAGGYNVRWFIIGDGEDREMLEAEMKRHRLEGIFELIGLKENPYPYIEQCDIYVQPSKFEGKSIAIDEAKILAKPIIVTNFSTARDQIRDGINGLIAPMDADSLAKTIAGLIDQPELGSRLSRELSLEKLGTEEEMDKLYELVGG
ncbi:glycosyltransferase [Paenibacillus sp. GCM10027627]|uniref:glycosyltransferase n=1 Tax=unclassified Paenibacillus TaxID=185978 RepID=UPI0036388169